MATHYPRRGGASDGGIDCGIFFIRINATDSATGWGNDAALS